MKSAWSTNLSFAVTYRFIFSWIDLESCFINRGQWSINYHSHDSFLQYWRMNFHWSISVCFRTDILLLHRKFNRTSLTWILDSFSYLIELLIWCNLSFNFALGWSHLEHWWLILNAIECLLLSPSNNWNPVDKILTSSNYPYFAIFSVDLALFPNGLSIKISPKNTFWNIGKFFHGHLTHIGKTRLKITPPWMQNIVNIFLTIRCSMNALLRFQLSINWNTAFVIHKFWTEAYCIDWSTLYIMSCKTCNKKIINFSLIFISQWNNRI